MAGFDADTSVLVATLCAGHEWHDWALSNLNERLDRAEEFALAAHSPIESYSVLTRLPPSHRIASAVAARLLEESFAPVVRVVGLPVRDHRALLRRAPNLESRAVAPATR